MQQKVVSARIDDSLYQKLVKESEYNKISVSDLIRRKIESKHSFIVPKARRNVATKRHLLKTISYRIISTGIGFFILWTTTGDMKIGAAFSVAELLYKPVVYFLHERAWYKYIKYGIK